MPMYNTCYTQSSLVIITHFAILFRPFGFVAFNFNYLAFQSFHYDVHDQGYSRKTSCALIRYRALCCADGITSWVCIALPTYPIGDMK